MRLVAFFCAIFIFFQAYAGTSRNLLLKGRIPYQFAFKKRLFLADGNWELEIEGSSNSEELTYDTTVTVVNAGIRTPIGRRSFGRKRRKLKVPIKRRQNKIIMITVVSK